MQGIIRFTKEKWNHRGHREIERGTKGKKHRGNGKFSNNGRRFLDYALRAPLGMTGGGQTHGSAPTIILLDFCRMFGGNDISIYE